MFYFVNLKEQKMEKHSQPFPNGPTKKKTHRESNQFIKNIGCAFLMDFYSRSWWTFMVTHSIRGFGDLCRERGGETEREYHTENG